MLFLRLPLARRTGMPVTHQLPACQRQACMANAIARIPRNEGFSTSLVRSSAKSKHRLYRSHLGGRRWWRRCVRANYLPRPSRREVDGLPIKHWLILHRPREPRCCSCNVLMVSLRRESPQNQPKKMDAEYFDANLEAAMELFPSLRKKE